MFIDYITVMLANMLAALVVLAVYFARGIALPEQKHYVPPLAATGLVATALGCVMSITWPVPKMALWANMAFGEMTLLLGVLLLGAALAIARGWKLWPLAIYAFIAGAIAIMLGVGIGLNGLTAAPAISAAGFILSGLAGVLSLPTVLWPSRPMRATLAIVLLLAAAVWALTTFMSYWAHLDRYGQIAKAAGGG